MGQHNQTANKAFHECWNGQPEDVPYAWLRAAESLRAFGCEEQARIARKQYVISLPVSISNETLVTASGRLIKQQTVNRGNYEY